MSQIGLRTFQNPDKRKQFESFAEDGGHYVYIETKHEGDKSLCSCGWSGETLQGGIYYAWTEWRSHVIKSTVIVQAEDEQNI